MRLTRNKRTQGHNARLGLLTLLSATCATACASGAVGTAAPEPSLCSEATRWGEPVTERLLRDGCRDGNESLVTFRPFLCRFEGYTALAYENKAVAIELALDPEGIRPSASPDTAYGVWRSPFPESPETDNAGCGLGDELPVPEAEASSG